MKNTILFLGLTLAVLGCGEKEDKGTEFVSELRIRQSAEEFESLVAEGASHGDPVWFDDLKIQNDSLYLSVHYYGGCEQHTFELVWNGAFTNTTPSLTVFAIIHNSNNDECRELIYETLAFNLSELSYPSDRRSVAAAVYSAEAPLNSVKTGFYDPPRNFQYNSGFEGSEDCILEVIGQTFFCNIENGDLVVLALNDSVSYDGINYFNEFLVAAQMPEDQPDFVLEPGKKYLVGATIIEGSDYFEWFGCTDVAGPVQIVRINCITEINP